MNKSITAANTATVCDKLTILAVNHISMLKQYVSMLHSLFRSSLVRSRVQIRVVYSMASSDHTNREASWPSGQ